MDAEERTALALRILEQSHADATEAIVVATDRALTRFTHEVVHQNVESSDIAIRIRAVVDGRTGVAETNRLDAPAIARALDRAAEIARFAPRDEGDPGLASASPPAATPAGAFVPATAAAGADARAAIAANIFAQAVQHACWSAGYVTTSTVGVTIATTAGARVSFDGSDAGVNVKMTAPDSTGFAERYSADVRTLDGTAIGAHAAAKARASATPVAVDPGEWTVILEPAAFGELLHFLAGHLSAQGYDEGSSFLSDRLGELVMGENVTIRDDYAHPLHPGMPFDWEGTPKTALPLIENGVARAVVTDRRWAKKLGRESTGHGLPAPNTDGPAPANLVVDAGTATLDELIATTKRGLLITRLWYVRNVDQRKTILTGMTRDGTFLIEDGTVRSGVRNLRFNQSLVDALTDAQFGREQARTGGYSYGCVVPPVKFARFTFASTTDY